MAGKRTTIETWASGKAKKNRLDIQRESSPAPQTNPPRGYDPFHYSVSSNRGAGQLFCFSFWWLWFEEANESLRSPVSSSLAGLGRRVGGRTKLTVSGEREATWARTVLLGFNRSCSSLHKTDGSKKKRQLGCLWWSQRG